MALASVQHFLLILASLQRSQMGSIEYSYLARFRFPEIRVHYPTQKCLGKYKENYGI